MWDQQYLDHVWNIQEYSVKYYESHITLLWIWIMRVYTYIDSIFNMLSSSFDSLPVALYSFCFELKDY
jgi:hypothetical protein